MKGKEEQEFRMQSRGGKAGGLQWIDTTSSQKPVVKIGWGKEIFYGEPVFHSGEWWEWETGKNQNKSGPNRIEGKALKLWPGESSIGAACPDRLGRLHPQGFALKAKALSNPA